MSQSATQTYEPEIPEVVREAGRRAEALQAELIGAAKPQAQEPASLPSDAEVLPDSQGGSESGFEPGSGSGSELGSGKKAAQGSSQEPSREPSLTEEELKRKLAQAQHDLSTWRGRHTADTKRLMQQIELLTKQIEEMRAASVPPIPEAPTVTDEERNTYGEDLLDVVKRQALVAVLPALKALEDRLVAQIESVRGAATVLKEETQTTRRERFFAYLDTHVPEWRTIDASPEFQSWLAEYDPLLRRTRKEVLDEAVNVFDGESTAAFVRTYLDQKEGSGPQVRRSTAFSGASQSAPATGRSYGRPSQAAAEQEQTEEPPSLMDFAAPGKASSPRLVPSRQPAARIWTLDEIKRTYADIGRGAYRDDPARQKALEYEMAAAQREGRVRV